MSRNAIHRAFRAVRAQAVVVDLALVRRRWFPFVQRHDASLDVWRQHFQMVIGAAVVIKEESLDAHQAMELDPFAEVGRFVQVDGAGGQVGCVGGQIAVDRKLRDGRAIVRPEHLFAHRHLDQALHVDHVPDRYRMSLDARVDVVGELELVGIQLDERLWTRVVPAEQLLQPTKGRADDRQRFRLEGEPQQRSEREHRRLADRAGLLVARPDGRFAGLDEPAEARYWIALVFEEACEHCSKRLGVPAGPVVHPPAVARRNEPVARCFERVPAHRSERLGEQYAPVAFVACRLQCPPQPVGGGELRLPLLEVERGLGPSVGGVLEESAPRSLVHPSQRVLTHPFQRACRPLRLR